MWANTNRTDPSRLSLTKNKILNLTNTLPALITFSEFPSTDFLKITFPLNWLMEMAWLALTLKDIVLGSERSCMTIETQLIKYKESKLYYIKLGHLYLS